LKTGRARRTFFRAPRWFVYKLEIVRICNLTFAVLLGSATLLAADRDEPNMRQYWASKRYRTNAFPDSWRPEKFPQPPADFEVLNKREAYLEVIVPIPKFIARFGLPNRYLTARKQEGYSDFLIYDLPSGTSIALYVTRPPASGIGAAIIVDRAGKVMRLIK
jgi:hypothetical protein